MSTTEINVYSATQGHASVGLSAVLVKAEGAVTNPPAPPPPAPPPSIGRMLLRLVNGALTADRLAQAAERWWPTVKELGKEVWDKLFRRTRSGQRPA